MAKNKHKPFRDESGEPVNEKAPGSAADLKPEGGMLWETRQWAGVKTVFMCKKCGAFKDSRDDMIEHVVGHAPEYAQSKLLDQLVKE